MRRNFDENATESSEGNWYYGRTSEGVLGGWMSGGLRRKSGAWGERCKEDVIREKLPMTRVRIVLERRVLHGPRSPVTKVE